MKKCLLALAISSSFWAGSVSANSPSIEIWNSDTVWAGQGICSAVFTIDAGWQDAPLTDLKIAIEAIGNDGSKLAAEVLEYAGPIGDSNATRYDRAFWESEEACEDNLTITVLGASARVEGKKIPITVTPRSFTPFQIIIKK